MRKSRIVTQDQHRNSNAIIKDVLQASIFNKGSKDVEVFGFVLKPNSSPFRIDASGTISDLELKNIVFTESGTVTENHITIAYQVLEKESC